MPALLEIFERNFALVKGLIRQGDAAGIETLLKQS